ncbi:DNA polymerase domain-containing protein [Promethearchaeum syntrophicum]|uniref:DNA-directed DNA polymerase n=1 Tax=Promethearchaeum syntrophicum TaxID=2594042 RepID=A0A5B9D6W8_9ARCH|nr:DNA polymerase domain-containing protein [Candidatus Prometheoarchaeum syntrophicum]QEE14898.1 DNA polymerase [Candidatus Prometheoarchaeum syntrophicum]
MQDILFDAWIIDLMVHEKGILLWLKKKNGVVVRAIYEFQPSFYIVPKKQVFNDKKTSNNVDYQKFINAMQAHPQIKSAVICKRRIKAEDSQFSQVIRIQVDSPFKFKKTVRQIKELEQFNFYNIDIPLTQMFFYETGLFPFAFCSFQLKKKQTDLIVHSIILNDSNESILYQFPPLRVIWLEIEVEQLGLRKKGTDRLKNCKLTVDPCSVNISLNSLFSPSEIVTDKHGRPQIIIEGKNERQMLFTLQVAIKKIDPDVIFTSHGDEELFPYLLFRASYLRLENHFSLSRDGASLKSTRFLKNGSNSFMSYGIVHHKSNSQFYLNGRMHIDSAIYGGLHFDDGNLFGLIEVARVTYSPLQRLTRVTIGGALQSLQFYHAYALGILIPDIKKNSEDFRESTVLLSTDRGGHILNPKIGLFRRVAEIDFTSMYPALMVQYNVSPEIVNCKCCESSENKVPGLDYHLCSKRKGIVPLSLRVPLTKRISYKNLSKNKNEHESKKYEKMEEALKWILVVCFGYLGFRNARFGRIEAHQTVCAYSRELLLEAMKICENHGLIMIHGIVDSLYVRAPDSMDDETFQKKCLEVVEKITQKSLIPIRYNPENDYFKFISFLPTKADPNVGALNRYWGVKQNGAIKVRGIELRRHDSPPFIKEFQQEMIEAISSSPIVDNSKWLLSSKIVPVLLKYYRDLESRGVNPEKLAITIRVTRRFNEYKVQNYQAIAARYLEKHGVSIGPGQKVSFVIVKDKARNPQDRVLPIDIYHMKNASYDISKYKELLVRALINLLPYKIPESIRRNLETLSGTQTRFKPKVQKPISAYFT